MDMLKHNKMYRLKVLLLLILDMSIIQVASFFALYIRYDLQFGSIERQYLHRLVVYAPVNTLLIIIIFFVFKMYSSIWRLASVKEMINLFFACVTSFFMIVVEMSFFGFSVPRSYPFIFIVFLAAGTFFVRFFYRFLRFFQYELGFSKKGKATMIIGGGQAAVMLIKEMMSSDIEKYSIRCIIDDDEKKFGRYVSGIRVVGCRNDIVAMAEKYGIELIIIAIPSADRKTIRDILEICKLTDCELKKVPAVYQLEDGNARIRDIRDVEVEDLLGRDQIKVDLDSIMGYVSGKVILVTGGGGSIGSELCRQIAMHKPKQLIIVDIYENNAYDIEQELKVTHPELNLVVLIASVRNTHRMQWIFQEYRPDVVYHAAAHKHVPLMETSPNEAIKNNVFGTYKTAVAAAENGVSKFVLISTDKAVNPTNIMGASKRICEMIIQMLDRDYPDTNFVAVRFGNVLGSNGSVIPLFKKQIKEGGPVTVTDPNIIRYFMTIPEAVSLVLQAGAYAKGGEIFVLDMGEPVKIVDLARNLIRLSGYTEEEIGIKFTGLRPGEKLYEELLMSEEGLKSTENKLIYIGQPIPFDDKEFKEALQRLRDVCKEDSADVRDYVGKIVTTYHY